MNSAINSFNNTIKPVHDHHQITSKPPTNIRQGFVKSPAQAPVEPEDKPRQQTPTSLTIADLDGSVRSVAFAGEDLNLGTLTGPTHFWGKGMWRERERETDRCMQTQHLHVYICTYMYVCVHEHIETSFLDTLYVGPCIMYTYVQMGTCKAHTYAGSSLLPWVPGTIALAGELGCGGGENVRSVAHLMQ